MVLPEAGCDFLDKLLPLVAHLGYRGWTATPPGVPDIMGVVLLAGRRTGPLEVEPRSDLRYRHLRASGGILGDRELFAVHVTAPRKPWLAVRWRRELGVVGRWTRRTPAPIVVGDLNATLDNGPLRAALGGCVSAARGRDALVGTYPSGLPRWFGIQIDHVLVPAGTATLRLRRARRVRDRSPGRGRAAGAARAVPALNLNVGSGAARPSDAAPLPTNRDAVVAKRTQGPALIHAVADFSALLRRRLGRGGRGDCRLAGAPGAGRLGLGRLGLGPGCRCLGGRCRRSLGCPGLDVPVVDVAGASMSRSVLVSSCWSRCVVVRWCLAGGGLVPSWSRPSVVSSVVVSDVVEPVVVTTPGAGGAGSRCRPSRTPLARPIPFRHRWFRSCSSGSCSSG